MQGPQRANAAIVVDAGPFVAMLNAADDHHEACMRWRTAVEDRQLLVPVPTLVEVCHLVEKRQGPSVEADFLASLADSPQFIFWSPDRAAFARMALLVERYANFPIGAADASVVVAAEQNGITEVATLDRRHFRAIRPAHVETFTLLPDDVPG